jgi:hypothetical protein
MHNNVTLGANLFPPPCYPVKNCGLAPLKATRPPNTYHHPIFLLYQSSYSINLPTLSIFLLYQREKRSHAYLWSRWSEGPNGPFFHGPKWAFPLELELSSIANAQSSSHCRPTSYPPSFTAVLLPSLSSPFSPLSSRGTDLLLK